MRASKIYFERTKSEPGFHNRRCGIEVELAKGESAKDALRKAEIFVATALNESPSPQQMGLALEIVQQGKEYADLPF
jgi:hypothetical protein